MGHPTRLPTAPVELAGIAGDSELSLAAKGVLLVALNRPPGRPLARAELLERGRDVRDLAELYRADPQQRVALMTATEESRIAPAGWVEAPAGTRTTTRRAPGDRRLRVVRGPAGAAAPLAPPASPPPERAPPLGPGVGARTRNPWQGRTRPPPPTTHQPTQ
jgi:hypothetical protein